MRKKVLFVASECVPFVKTGGLADVVGSLPKYFDREKYEVRVILPNYLCISSAWKEKMNFVTNFYMDMAWRSQYVGILEMEYEGIQYYFIDNEYYFAGDKPYGYIHEDVEKFAFFSKAALSILPVVEYQPDIVHCHDWQTGLIPVYLRDSFHEGAFYANMKSIMTIHNLKFQGIWNIPAVQDATGLDMSYFKADKLEAFGDANYLKGGIVYSDYVTTVSRTYAEEIKTPYFGEHLDGLMRARSGSLFGIVNGLDYGEWDPKTDPLICKNYSEKTFRTDKVKNKLELQKELGLEVNKKKMLIGIVSRLTDQKGFDLIDCVMDELCQDEVQIVVLGTGEERYENMFRHFAWKYGGKVAACIYYS
ncbi:MAG: glycogen synthase, partial [Lachnospiraceae bacterium]|nr:glycogen synthase [Lachnospiraceae bacterium]